MASDAQSAARSLAAAFHGAAGAVVPDDPGGREALTGTLVAAAVVAPGECDVDVRPDGHPAAEGGTFAVGSVTKTMTGVLLASLVLDDVVRLADPIGHWLAAGPHGGITLLQLATHTAGLPRLATDAARHVLLGEAGNPYARFTARDAEAALSGLHSLDTGRYRYSNFGFQLLGLALERAAGASYASLLAERLLRPLGMTASGVLPSDHPARVTGYAGGRPTAHWEQPLPAAGAVETTVPDLGRYLRACADPDGTPLAAAVRMATAPHADAGNGHAAGLGWWIAPEGLAGHTGETGGFSAAMAVDPRRGTGAAAVTNTGGLSVALDRGIRLLLSGQDPAGARPEAPDLVWRERTGSFVRSLAAGDAAGLRAAMAPHLRERVPAQNLLALWTMRTLGAGEPERVTVDCRSVSAGTAAEATVLFPGHRSVRLALVYDRQGAVAALAMPRQGEAAPW